MDDPDITLPDLPGDGVPTVLGESAEARMLAAAFIGAGPPQETTASGPPDWQPPSVEELQRQLPQFTIEKLIARGGMGAVYKGIQKSLQRPVAIKVLPPGLMHFDPNFAARFKREARAMALLSHSNIVTVYDAGETPKGLLYFVMEFIEGTDMAQLISRQGRLAQAQVAGILETVCEALDFAHKSGIIHRDIKPSNIMIDASGRVKVADFGLAKLTNADSSLKTSLNVAMGTPDFLAPEALVAGAVVDCRADIYALGVMLYQMLTGTIPRGRFQLPSAVTSPQVHRGFDAIVDRAMQVDREKRYSSALELRSALARIAASLPRAAAPRPGRWKTRTAVLVAVPVIAAMFTVPGSRIWKALFPARTEVPPVVDTPPVKKPDPALATKPDRDPAKKPDPTIFPPTLDSTTPGTKFDLIPLSKPDPAHAPLPDPVIASNDRGPPQITLGQGPGMVPSPPTVPAGPPPAHGSKPDPVIASSKPVPAVKSMPDPVIASSEPKLGSNKPSPTTGGGGNIYSVEFAAEFAPPMAAPPPPSPFGPGYGDKLPSKKVGDGIADISAIEFASQVATPRPAGASSPFGPGYGDKLPTLSPGPQAAADAKPKTPGIDALWKARWHKPGRLKATGTDPNGEPWHLEKAEPYSDFVQVISRPPYAERSAKSWYALRANGDLLTPDGRVVPGVISITRSESDPCIVYRGGRISELTSSVTVYPGPESISTSLPVIDYVRCEQYCLGSAMVAAYQDMKGEWHLESPGFASRSLEKPDITTLPKVTRIILGVYGIGVLREDHTLRVWSATDGKLPASCDRDVLAVEPLGRTWAVLTNRNEVNYFPWVRPSSSASRSGYAVGLETPALASTPVTKMVFGITNGGEQLAMRDAEDLWFMAGSRLVSKALSELFRNDSFSIVVQKSRDTEGIIWIEP